MNYALQPTLAALRFMQGGFRHSYETFKNILDKTDAMLLFFFLRIAKDLVSGCFLHIMTVHQISASRESSVAHSLNQGSSLFSTLQSILI